MSNLVFFIKIISMTVIYDFLIVFFLIKYKRMNNTIEHQNLRIETLELDNEMLSKKDDSIRSFKHDFFNFVQALDGYSQNNDIDSIRKMNQSILEECEEINNIEILDPKVIKDYGVYNILTKKYFLAKKENITMKFEILTDISKSKISNYHLCRILSILLDNAIEAAKECDEKIINVKFVKEDKANRQLVVIENSYKKLDIDIDKIFEKGFSTKLNSSDHGLGLWNVRKILTQTKNLNLFTKKEKLFSQQLEIYN